MLDDIYDTVPRVYYTLKVKFGFVHTADVMMMVPMNVQKYKKVRSFLLLDIIHTQKYGKAGWVVLISSFHFRLCTNNFLIYHTRIPYHTRKAPTVYDGTVITSKRSTVRISGIRVDN